MTCSVAPGRKQIYSCDLFNYHQYLITDQSDTFLGTWMFRYIKKQKLTEKYVLYTPALQLVQPSCFFAPNYLHLNTRCLRSRLPTRGFSTAGRTSTPLLKSLDPDLSGTDLKTFFQMKYYLTSVCKLFL